MCNEECDGELMEECRYDKENCEYKCSSPFEIDEYSYSASPKETATIGFAAFLAAINF